MRLHKKGVSTTGYCALTADILHKGHINYLKKCKENCDYLIVGVMTDKCVKKYKGALPVIPYKERRLIIENLKLADKVVSQNCFEMTPNLKEYKPNIVFDSTNHNREQSYKYAQRHSMKVVKIDYDKTQSSTKIKEKIKNETSIEADSNTYYYPTGAGAWTNV